MQQCLSRALAGLLLCGCLLVLGVRPPPVTAAQQDCSISITSVTTDATNSRVDATVLVRAAVSSVCQVQTVVAATPTRSGDLSWSNNQWTGTIVTSDLPRGPFTLTVTATDIFGNAAQRTITLTHDAKPAISISSPAFYAVGRPALRVTAMCSDDDPAGCSNLSVYGRDSSSGSSYLFASGATSLDQDVPSGVFDGRRIELEFVATDSAGQTTRTTRLVYVESNPRLVEVVHLPGPIVADGADAVLFLDEMSRVSLYDKTSAQTTIILSGTDNVVPHGFVTPMGAMFVHRPASGNVLSSRLYEYRSGTLIDRGLPNGASSLRVSGNYAVWSDSARLYLEDLTSGVVTLVTNQAGNNENDVASNGDVAYWSYPTPPQIIRYRAGTTATLTSDTSARNVYPRTDGINIAYHKRPQGGPYSSWLLTSGGEVQLSLPTGVVFEDDVSLAPGRDYLVNGGWTAFTKWVSGSRNAWVRSPAGDMTQLTAFNDDALALSSLNDDGRTAWTRAQRLFVGGPSSPTGEIGSARWKTFWRDGQLYVIVGSSLMRVSDCTYTVSPLTASFGAQGGSSTVTITTQPGCTWTAASNRSYASVQTPAGSGSGTVGYSVEPTTSARDGSLIIAGQTLVFTQTTATGAPGVATQPSNQSAPVNTNATFTVAGVGLPAPSYQWQEQINGQGAWNDLSASAQYAGTQTNALTIASVPFAISGSRYRCVVSNSVGSATSDAAILTVTGGAEFVLVWNDEFGGAANTEVDTGLWRYDIGTGYPGGPPNWGTGEVETMSRSMANVYQDGSGHLVIKPIHAGATATSGWTSGRIETERAFAPPSGGVLAVEASLQQPNVSGGAAAGYWPAFWMLGARHRGNFQNWPAVGEIDIMETVNGQSETYATFHCGTNPGGPCNETIGITSGPVACAGCQTSYRTYRVELDKSRTPEQIRWYLDGVNVFTVNATQVDATTWTSATESFLVLLSVAIGGSFPGAPTAATASDVPMLVDYVRIYMSPATEAPPVVVLQPSSQEKMVGQVATFAASASGLPYPLYRWQRSTDGGASWADLIETEAFTGVTSSTLTVATTAANNGDKYRVVATNTLGVDQSTVATLVVNTGSDVRAAIDSPRPNGTVGPSFTVIGWALDLGAGGDTGVDDVHLWAFPTSGGPGQFLGRASYGFARPDLGAMFGPRFGSAGFTLNVTGLDIGQYRIVVYPHSRISGAFGASWSVDVNVSSVSMPAMALDAPTDEATVSAFSVAGWAIDRAAGIGAGVGAVHVWAFPSLGGGVLGAGQFLGAATLGGTRTDVGAIFGSQFTNSGFSLASASSGLAPGTYEVCAFAQSTVTGTFNQAACATVTLIEPQGSPAMAIDTPRAGTTHAGSFVVAGWAIDWAAAAGPGVDVIHVWAFDRTTGAGQFVGVASYGAPRPDVGAIFGAQFTNVGYTVTVSGLPAGEYDVGVFVHSTVTGTFNQASFVLVTVP